MTPILDFVVDINAFRTLENDKYRGDDNQSGDASTT
jgi:hypothetical protein